MEKLKLFYSSKVEEPLCDLKRIFSYLNDLKKAGISVDLFDTAEISLSELYGHYIKDAVPSSVRKRYRIAHLFGTQKRSGIFFGKEQPSLLFYAEGEFTDAGRLTAKEPTDVYPHDKGGRRISIEEFLLSKLE